MSYSTGRTPGFRLLARQNQASAWRGLLSSPPIQMVGLNVDLPRAGDPEANWRGQIGSPIFRSTGGRGRLGFTGISRDSSGNVLANATLYLISLPSYDMVAQTVSDDSGNFRFDILPPGPYQIQAYLAGSPDLAGASVNTLQPT